MSVRTFVAVAAVSVATILSLPSVARAQGLPTQTSLSFAAAAAAAAPAPAEEKAEQTPLGQLRLPAPAVVRMPGQKGGRNLLASLYATTATMQMLDVDSTLKSMRRGAVESNPLMAGLVGNKAAFFGMKAGVAAATIYAAHKIAKDNKLAAVITLVGINSAYAMIVKNNYAIANR